VIRTMRASCAVPLSLLLSSMQRDVHGPGSTSTPTGWQGQQSPQQQVASLTVTYNLQVPAALSSQGVSGDGEVAGGGDTASVLSLPATAVTTAMPDPDLKRASTTATAARVAPAEALMRAAARKGNVRPTWTLGLLVGGCAVLAQSKTCSCKPELGPGLYAAC
jgi:hypothetical protein